MILSAIAWTIGVIAFFVLGDYIAYKLGNSARQQKKLNKEAIADMHKVYNHHLSIINNKENKK